MTLINGREQARLPAADRGLQFGDGVFETMAVDEGRPLCLERHLERLSRGCARLAIPVPALNILEEESVRVCGGAVRAVLKLTVTRGVGGRGYAVDESARPTRVLARHPWPGYAAASRRSGVSLRVCRTRLGRNRALAGVKHLNRLEQVLARMEDNPGQCEEGLMLDDRDDVIEGITSNVFVCRNGRLSTPDLSECGVAGIIRELVLDAAREVTGNDAQITQMSMTDLQSADECFLTNSLIGLWPVRAIDGKALKVGPLALAMQALLLERGAIVRD
jgi:4-amino-4-deoxychorismate lyase